MIEIVRYLDRNGRDVFDAWFSGLADRRTQARIAIRIDRLSAGNLGDCKSLGHGLHELRIDFGSGYRVYYATIVSARVLLLCGGDKRKQSADIRRAFNYFRDYKQRTKTK